MKITVHLLSCRMLCNGISGCFFQSQDCKSTQFCNKTLCHHLAQSEISLMICRESRSGNCSELQWTLMAFLQIFPLHMRRIACLVPTRSKLAFKLNGFVISIADFLHKLHANPRPADHELPEQHSNKHGTSLTTLVVGCWWCCHALWCDVSPASNYNCMEFWTAGSRNLPKWLYSPTPHPKPPEELMIPPRACLFNHSLNVLGHARPSWTIHILI